MTERAVRIAIVGAGFTGTMLAVQLLRRFTRPIEITLIDRRGSFGRGLAYSARNPRHLLNVRVSNMSAFDDDPQHFIRWLWEHDTIYNETPGVPPSGHAFVSRATFGAYVEDVFLSAVEAAGHHRATVTQSVGDVVDLRAAGEGVRLLMGNGREVDVDRAVLSVGNFPPAPPFPLSERLAESRQYIADPWDESAKDRIGESDSVLIVGTGLTMVDVVVDLVARGHRGSIRALSRRGLLPNQHELTRIYPPFLERGAIPGSALRLMRRIRGEVGIGRALGYDWRSVMDAVRPIIQDLWQALPEQERRRFLRHLRPYWDIHRHRMAPAIAKEINALRAEARLIASAGRIGDVDFAEDKVRLVFRPRDGNPAEHLTADWMINCSGPECDYRRIRDPLIENLLASGLARPDPLSLGLDLTDRFELVSRDGGRVENVYALGPPARGVLWEATAVPDIRKQCAQFAAWVAEGVANE
jgi:uncharacterized NAD(P)/FAD-binding protein YdhS